MNVVLFGGSGQVGVELRRTLAPLGRLVVLGRAEADLARPETVRAVLRGHPADVVVNEVAGEQATVLELRVAPDDVGKVIGKQGRTARSIRTILSAAGMKLNRRFTLEILE